MAKVKNHSKDNVGDKYNHFVRLRLGLKEHIKSGKMQGRDLGTYVAIHFHADYRTGMAYHISAPYLATFLREPVHKIRRSLRRLEEERYIRRFGHRGHVSGYDILINKYLVMLNVSQTYVNCILIDAFKSPSSKELAWTVTQPCMLIVSQTYVNCIPSVFQVSPIVDIIDIKIADKKNSRGKKPPTPKSFTPPTVDDVKEYADSIDYPELDAKYFCEYYTAADWKRKDGEPVRNWKRAVVTWKKRDKERQDDEEPTIHKPQTPTEEQLAIIEGKQR